MQIHFEAKHPKLPWEPEKCTNLHELSGGVTTQVWFLLYNSFFGCLYCCFLRLHEASKSSSSHLVLLQHILKDLILLLSEKSLLEESVKWLIDQRLFYFVKSAGRCYQGVLKEEVIRTRPPCTLHYPLHSNCLKLITNHLLALYI